MVVDDLKRRGYCSLLYIESIESKSIDILIHMRHTRQTLCISGEDKFAIFFRRTQTRDWDPPIRNQTERHQTRHNVDSGDDKFIKNKKSQQLIF